jgi:hypothetical protein
MNRNVDETFEHTSGACRSVNTAKFRFYPRQHGILWLAIVLMSPAFLGMFACPSLEAGTVFMKNGYIIQGPVVNQELGMVVLGWPYGKVTIYRRFYDNVVLEPGEAEIIARNQAAAEYSDEDAEEEIVIKEGDALPENFAELAKRFDLIPTAPLDPTETIEVDPFQDPQSDVETEVTQLPDAPFLADRQEIKGLGLSIEPPKGWSQVETETGVRWVGQAQQDAFIPSIVVTSGPVTRHWNVDEARAALREDPKEAIGSVEVVSEEEIRIEDRVAYQVVSQGPVQPEAHEGQGADSQTTLSLRQVLVPGGERFWLVSTFSTDNSDVDSVLALEQSLQSL